MELATSVPKPAKKKKKRRKSKLQKKKENFNSGYWLKKCDTVFGQIFHSQNSCPCIVGKYLGFGDCKGNTEMMHLIPRENYLYRWNKWNVLPGCSYHHKYSREISAHNAPHAFFLFIQEYLPEYWKFIQENRNVITRKTELPWTFYDKYLKLFEVKNKLGIE